MLLNVTSDPINECNLWLMMCSLAVEKRSVTTVGIETVRYTHMYSP